MGSTHLTVVEKIHKICLRKYSEKTYEVVFRRQVSFSTALKFQVTFAEGYNTKILLFTK